MKQENEVSDPCNIHQHHDHQHGDTCGCKQVKHGDHVDYVHDGHLHRIHGNHVDECPGGIDAKPGSAVSAAG
jgi:hypothetical protein